MFQIGDKVVHPMHGAGVIESITREKIGGKMMEFYVFRMPISGLTLKIPTENTAAVGMRAVKSADEIEAVIARIPQLGVDMTAVFQHQPGLLGVEGDLLLGFIDLAAGMIHQPFHRLAPEHGLFKDLLAVLRLYL